MVENDRKTFLLSLAVSYPKLRSSAILIIINLQDGLQSGLTLNIFGSITSCLNLVCISCITSIAGIIYALCSDASPATIWPYRPPDRASTTQEPQSPGTVPKYQPQKETRKKNMALEFLTDIFLELYRPHLLV